MKSFTRFLRIFTIFITSFASAENRTDMVIFSYNRPLQLYALLESIDSYITGINETKVIYRAGNDNFANAYEQVKAEFTNVDFIQQGNNPKADFKPLTLEVTFGSSGDYVVFAVDDIIITDFVDLNECVDLLEETGAYGFYLRLGMNITECYSLNKKTPVPPHTKIADGAYIWRFGNGKGDWGYPHSVDLNVFKKEDIQADFNSMNYKAPNVLEGRWAGRANLNQYGLFYTYSKMINIPMNLVQNEYTLNNNMKIHDLSVNELLNLFDQGLKIDIKSTFQMRNSSPHIEYMPRFIPR